jgi:hypothetical protein
MKLTSLFIFFCISYLLAQAQDTTVCTPQKPHKPYSVTFSLFNHAVAMPFHKMINKPFHPGIQAGIEARYFETNRSKLFQAFNLGMFYNKYNGTGFYLNTDLSYRYTSRYNIYAEIFAGVGYLRTYHPVDIFELTSPGIYEKARDKGFSSAIVTFGFGLGYSIKSSTAFSFAPFIRYGCLIQTHYSPDLGVLPHAALHAGVRINKKRRK